MVAPEVVAHCGPLVVPADLHATLEAGAASNQSDVTIGASCSDIQFHCHSIVAKATATHGHKAGLLTDGVVETSEAGVFAVRTVVVANSIVGAVEEVELSSCAEEVVQKDGASSLTKWCSWKSDSTLRGEAQLTASDGCIEGAPEVVTHGAPGVVVTDLHTSLVGIGAIHQTDITSHACYIDIYTSQIRAGSIVWQELRTYLNQLACI